ncbi:AN1-type zinc finger protein 2A [Drosophila subpulchrella]|uniref:AN1-type zinc finger protein 2A n=1 Tax=Drosophila subpulchrella TaxID=1486046 RepID=UPI0018A18891|nr:AN1-type zinc finger protein 2A [Drosophila subpulchrella]
MEFPHLGQHCSEQTCNRLDFLPVKCDSCDKVFCASHYNYDRHNCPAAHRKNVQVPICPLCREPVPTPPGVEPDITVGQHIDQQCKSESKKIYTNRCHAKGCKRKELIPVTCSQCHLNFCLRHRHTSDHNCQPSSARPAATASSSSGSGGWQSIFKTSSDTRSMAAQAAERRRQSKPPSSSISSTNFRPRPVQATQVQNIQGNMSEDEALARALALSIMEQDDAAERNRQAPTPNNAQQVSVGGAGNQQGNAKDKCLLS